MDVVTDHDWKVKALRVVKSEIIQRIEEGEIEIIRAMEQHLEQKISNEEPLSFAMSFSAKIDPSFYPRKIKVETGASWTVKGSKKEGVELNLEPSLFEDAEEDGDEMKVKKVTFGNVTIKAEEE